MITWFIISILGIIVCVLLLVILKIKKLQAYKISRLHHRIKNDLQLLVSILNIQGTLAGDSADAGSVEKNLSKASSRVAVMALIHQAVQKSAKPGFFDGVFFVKELCKSLSNKYPGIPFEITGNLYLKDEESAGAGLFLNEVIENAFRFYNCLSVSEKNIGDGYKIKIHLDGISGSDCIICVSNPGDYFDESMVFEKGSVPNMGLMLARTLSGQLRGSLKIESAKTGVGEICNNTVLLKWKSAGQDW